MCPVQLSAFAHPHLHIIMWTPGAGALTIESPQIRHTAKRFKQGASPNWRGLLAGERAQSNPFTSPGAVSSCSSAPSSSTSSSYASRVRSSWGSESHSAVKQALPTCIAGLTPEIRSTSFSSSAPREEDEHRLRQRQKQIDYGKNTLGYDRYCKLVDRARREPSHPVTPDVALKISTKRFNGLVRSWRRKLHMWDPPSAAPPPTEQHGPPAAADHEPRTPYGDLRPIATVNTSSGWGMDCDTDSEAETEQRKRSSSCLFDKDDACTSNTSAYPLECLSDDDML